MALVLSGCATPPPFEVRQSARLGEQGYHRVASSRGNRLSEKSVSGGILMDDLGLYLDPVFARPDDGSPELLALAIRNRTTADTRLGRPNSIGIPRLVILTLDGRTIGLPVLDGAEKQAEAIYDPLGRYAVAELTESGLAYLTAEQYFAILRAKDVSIKIVGSRQTASYAMKDLDAAFLRNLRDFFAMHVDGRSAVADATLRLKPSAVSEASHSTRQTDIATVVRLSR